MENQIKEVEDMFNVKIHRTSSFSIKHCEERLWTAHGNGFNISSETLEELVAELKKLFKIKRR